MRPTWWMVVLSLTGCKASHPGVDLGGGPDGGNTPGLTAVATCTDGLVGLRISCDGKQSADSAGRTLTYAWSVTGVPNGSTDASTGTGPTFSFAPQFGGTYEITLVVSTSDGASVVKAGALAETVPLFYRQSTITKTSDSFAVGIVRSDGSDAHLLSCPVMIADPSNGDAGAGNRGNYADTPGALGTRVFYRANNLPAVVAFENVTATEHQLLVNDEDGDCASRPAARLDATPAAQHLVPRFSPSGARVAWIDVDSPMSSLVTANVDGSDRRVVRTAAKLKAAPPVWSDETHLSWVEDASANATPRLQIAGAADTAGAGDTSRTTVIDCDSATDATALTIINQLESSAAGYIVAGGVKSRTANPPGATILYKLAGTSCSTTAATVLADEPSGSYAWDFALSPDGATLVMSAVEGPGSGAQDLWLVPLDGSVPPSRFVGSAPGVNDIGPMWIADGKQIAWTQVATDGSARGGGLMVANRDGSSVRSVLAQGGSTTAEVFVAGATNRGLDCSAAGTGVAVGDALLLVGAIFFIRRRRSA
jgi:hypothetical protein